MNDDHYSRRLDGFRRADEDICALKERNEDNGNKYEMSQDKAPLLHLVGRLKEGSSTAMQKIKRLRGSQCRQGGHVVRRIPTS